MPEEHVGAVITLCIEKRGHRSRRRCNTWAGQVSSVYELPMAEVVMDFFDRLKSVSRGYASLDYDFDPLRGRANLRASSDILINGERGGRPVG